MGLFDQLGGKEWVRAVGLRLDGMPVRNEVRLILTGHRLANRIGVTSRVEKGEAVYAATWWKVADDGEDAEPVREVEVDDPRELAAVIAADVRRMAVVAA